ncbi:phage protein [Megasphaera sueciensis]|uniref:phage protein n=1 Tax=Megasphaera sueciensis TaxID=349094 RepID=UPI003D044577
MSVSTYSFKDVVATISHPSYGSYSIQGEGVGEILIAKSTERTATDIAADGSVMISKVEGNNGIVTIQAQQTSGLHKFLQGMFNYLVNADSSEWAQISMTVKSTNMGKTHYCSYGAFQKESDNPYQTQGQKVSWALPFADIQNIAA